MTPLPPGLLTDLTRWCEAHTPQLLAAGLLLVGGWLLWAWVWEARRRR